MTQTTAQNPPLPWRRYLGVAIVIGVILLVSAWWYMPQYRVGRWIADLHSGNRKTIAAARQNLRSSDQEGIEELMLERMGDADLPFAVRRQLAEILLERNRLNVVEQGLRSDNVAARRAALAALELQVGRRGTEWFERDYVQRAEFRVPETVLDWLEEERDGSRNMATRIVGRLGLQEAVPALRKIVSEPERLGQTTAQRNVLWTAAQALVALGDCDSVPLFVKPALEDPSDLVRFHMLKVLYQATRGGRAQCADAVPEAEIKRAVIAALDGPGKTRHNAVLILRGEPAWTLEAETRLLALLDDLGPEEFARRDALATLAASGSEAFARRLPRYFHDANPYVRSEAAMSARSLGQDPNRPVKYVAAWIGLLENETDNVNAVTAALTSLREKSGTWIGLPGELKEAATRSAKSWVAFKEEIFEKGESRGLARRDWAEAWWRWWAAEMGLTDEEVDRAWADRLAFWQAARAGDVVGARKVLEAAPRRDEGLFTYEEGWVDAQG